MKLKLTVFAIALCAAAMLTGCSSDSSDASADGKTADQTKKKPVKEEKSLLGSSKFLNREKEEPDMYHMQNDSYSPFMWKSGKQDDDVDKKKNRNIFYDW